MLEVSDSLGSKLLTAKRRQGRHPPILQFYLGLASVRLSNRPANRNCSGLRGSEEVVAGEVGIASLSPPGTKECCQGQLRLGALRRAGAATDLAADDTVAQTALGQVVVGQPRSGSSTKVNRLGRYLRMRRHNTAWTACSSAAQPRDTARQAPPATADRLLTLPFVCASQANACS